MSEQGVDRLASAVDDVEDALGQTGLFEEFAEEDGGEWDFLTGLEDEGIAAREGEWEHP